jgi:hypothetical protein
MNKYAKNFNLEKTLYPNLFAVISGLPDEMLFFNNHQPQLRHPGAILNRATEEIEESFLKILTVLTNVHVEADSKKLLELRRSVLAEMATLLGHFDSFQDECYLILKTLSPLPVEDKAFGQKYVSIWLKANGYKCADDFLGRTGTIQKLIDCLTNRLKHANQKLEYIEANVHGIKIPGFFIEELKGEELSVIYCSVPKKSWGATVAISFNSFLQLLLLAFYEICDSLEKVIKKHIKMLHKVDFTRRNILKHSDKFYQVVTAIADIPEYFYPYEYARFARFLRERNIYKVSYPHNVRVPYLGPLNIESMHSADGYTNTFNLPFVG